MRLLLILAAMVVTGCDGRALDFSPKPNQDRAVHAAWSLLGARTLAPAIAWMPETSRCSDGRPGLDAPYGGGCVGGYYGFGSGYVVVMWNGAFHSSVLAHELVHAWQFQDKHVIDPLHEIAGDWTQVPAINYELRDSLGL